VYSNFGRAFDIVQNLTPLEVMPRFTEDRIQQLCSTALVVRNSDDVERVVSELRAALGQHIQMAKESLENQVATLSVLEAKASGNRSTH
jgi:hypothetical protein